MLAWTVMSPPASAQPAAENTAQAAIRTFNIAPQALAEALIEFGRQAGLQVSVESGLIRGLRTAGVAGTMSRDQALTALLEGTGLVYRVTGSMVAIERPGTVPGSMQLDPVRVQANTPPPQAMIDNLPPAFPGGQVGRGGQVGLLGERDVMDTPFNQSNYTAKLIQDQQARSIADVVANDPSVRNVWPGVSYTSQFNVRGFPLSSQDMSFNGMYGAAPTLTITPEYLERVEVLKGTSAMLNGMAPFGSIGGAINMVPKRAADQSLARVAANYYSSGQFGGHVDFGHRFGDDKSFGVRLNAVYRNGNTPVDRQTQEMAAGVLGMDFRGERFRASLDYGYQKERVNSPLRPTFVNAGVGVPLAPGGRDNWFQPWTYVNTEDVFGVAKVEYDITSDWTVFAGASARSNRFEALTGFANVTSASGNLIDSPAIFPTASNANSQEAGIRGRATTGPISHAVSLVGTHFAIDVSSFFSPIMNIASNLYRPTFVAQPNVIMPVPPKVSATQLTSVALADVLSAFDDRLQLIVGARYQRIQATNFSGITGAVTQYYDQGALSPGVAFVVKPWANVSLYGNFIQGLQQGPTAPAGTTNAGQTFSPIKSQQFELGGKVDFGRFAMTLAAFQIEQPSGFTNPSTMVFGVDGLQRNLGLEWNIFGEPLAGFRTLGGITLLDGRLVNTASPLTNGMKATGVPDVQINLGAEWDASFLRGLTFSGRAIYTSLQYLDPANTQSIPGWTRFDAGVRYSFERADGKPISLRFNVENLFDLNYWASANSTFGLSMGAPRTFLVSLTADF
jgi:iron complex outermembrane receptor protein